VIISALYPSSYLASLCIVFLLVLKMRVKVGGGGGGGRFTSELKKTQNALWV
jgi:hypothetical protein